MRHPLAAQRERQREAIAAFDRALEDLRKAKAAAFRLALSVALHAQALEQERNKE